MELQQSSIYISALSDNPTGPVQNYARGRCAFAPYIKANKLSKLVLGFHDLLMSGFFYIRQHDLGEIFCGHVTLGD